MSNFVLLGYGRMGKRIQEIAEERGHQILLATSHTPISIPDNADAVINFSTPDSAFELVALSLSQGIPVISGTTGWDHLVPKANEMALENNTAFIYSSNFSLGVNLTFAVNKKLAELLKPYSQYKISIEEIHHKHKLDAPSGTAISLAQPHKEARELDGYQLGDSTEKLPIYSIRKGEIPGTHHVHYKSDIDEITLSHEAHNRDGFALGSVIAAEWIVGKRGIFTMNDVLNL
ncbi:MAG: 4-hydroxy-tetrahydrodipicolinate reductase [Flavobacteriaceae bacterium]